VRRSVVYILLCAEGGEGGGSWRERVKDRKGEGEERRRSKENIPYRIQSKKPVLWIRRLDRHYFARSGSVSISTKYKLSFQYTVQNVIQLYGSADPDPYENVTDPEH
jgi:hypothetical protein